jgi:hypothetical protein
LAPFASPACGALFMLQHGGGIGGRQPMLYNNFHVNVNEIMTRANYTFNWAAK